MAQPTEYTPELGAEIADIHSGGVTVSEIAKRPDMPARKTILLWLAEYPEFEIMMAQAKNAYVDALAEECLKISDADQDDFTKELGKAGEEIYKYDRDAVARAKVKIDTRLKLIAKWAPERYAQRAGGKAAGEAGAAAREDAKITDNELARRILFGLERHRRGVPLPANDVKIPVTASPE